MNVHIVRKWGTSKTEPRQTKLLVTLRHPDGVYYWSGLRAAPATAKVATVVVATEDRLTKTDLWISDDQRLILGGYVCKDCGHRQTMAGRCTGECGGPNVVPIRFRVEDKETKKVREAVRGDAGQFPMFTIGARRRNVENRLQPDWEMFPEATRETLVQIWAKGFDFCSFDEIHPRPRVKQQGKAPAATQEEKDNQRLILPLVAPSDWALTDETGEPVLGEDGNVQEAKWLQVLTNLKEARENAGLEIIGF